MAGSCAGTAPPAGRAAPGRSRAPIRACVPPSGMATTNWVTSPQGSRTVPNRAPTASNWNAVRRFSYQEMMKGTAATITTPPFMSSAQPSRTASPTAPTTAPHRPAWSRAENGWVTR
ncbi:hypothetical protein STANM309S_00007 [Streptomyces tanashiensis]